MTKEETIRSAGIKVRGPPVFTGRQEDWIDWSFRFKAYASSVNPRLAEALRAMTPGMTEDQVYSLPNVRALLEERQDGQIYYALLSFVEGEARTLVMRQTNQSGMLAWKLLVDRYTVNTEATSAVDIEHIVRMQFTAHDFLRAFTAWESLIAKFEHDAGTALTDKVKS